MEGTTLELGKKNYLRTLREHELRTHPREASES